MRFKMTLLSQAINKMSQIDKKELINKFLDNMRFKMTSLSQSINKISQIDKKRSKKYIYR